MLRWGILGPGAVARRFAEELASSQTGRLWAVASRTSEHAATFAAEFGADRSYGSYDELLTDDTVDAVYVATVPSAHADLAVRAATAGRHVLVEKPLAVTAAQATDVVRAARVGGVFLAEVYLYRFHPQTTLLLELIRDGAIGTLHAIEASCGSMVQPWPASGRADPALGGGGIVAVGCYPVSMARLVAGAAQERAFADPDSLVGSGTVGDTGVDEWAVGTLTFAGGLTARVAAGLRAGDDGTLKVYGSRGHVLVPSPWLLEGAEAGSVVLTTVGRGRRTLRSAPAQPYRLAVEAVAQRDDTLQVSQMSWADSLGNARTLDRWRAAVGMSYPFEV